MIGLFQKLKTPENPKTGLLITTHRAFARTREWAPAKTNFGILPIQESQVRTFSEKLLRGNELIFNLEAITYLIIAGPQDEESLQSLVKKFPKEFEQIKTKVWLNDSTNESKIVDLKIEFPSNLDDLLQKLEAAEQNKSKVS